MLWFCYLQSAKVKEILQEQEQSGRIIGAICAGINVIMLKNNLVHLFGVKNLGLFANGLYLFIHAEDILCLSLWSLQYCNLSQSVSQLDS